MSIIKNNTNLCQGQPCDPMPKKDRRSGPFDLRSLAFLNEIVDHVHDDGSDEGQKGA